MRWTWTFVLLLLLILSHLPNAQASEIYQFYTGIREMALGGTYVNDVNDETALLTNPAGLGKIRDYSIMVADPEVDLNGTVTQLFNSGNYSSALDSSAIVTAMSGNPNTHYHVKAQGFPSLVLPNFGIGLHAMYRYDADTDSTGNKVTLHITQDYAAVLGYNLRLWGGIVKIGFDGRYVDRSEINNITYTAAQATTLSFGSAASEGSGLATDIGLIITAPVYLLPSIGAVVRDLGNTSYTLGNGAFYSVKTRPVDTIQTIDVGLSLSPLLGRYVRSTFTLQANDVSTIGDETDVYRRVHAGIEFNVADFFFLRGGWNEHYWTAGIEFSTEHLQLQFTSYGEDIGTSTTPLEDRRTMGKLAFRF